MPVNVDLARFPRLVCGRCGLVALVDPDLPRDEYASLACPRCRGRLGKPRIRPTELPEEPPAASRKAGALPDQAPLPSHAAVGLSIAAIFLLLLVGFFIFLLLTPHNGTINPYVPKP